MSHSPLLPHASLKIRILATSDLHMNLRGFDYYSDKPDPTIGFSRTATLIRDARSEAEAEGAITLLFDNGDSLQGTPVGDWAVEPANAPHILMRAFNVLGYDAVGLGNHDFSFGLDALDGVIADAMCPVICSNARRLDTRSAWQDQAILTRTTNQFGRNVSLKIGVFSVLPPQTAKWETQRLKGKVVVDDILSCAQQQVQDLLAQDCDLILALAHTGLGPATPQPDLENAIIPLAAIDGIDALIAGHSHLTLPGQAHDGLDHVDASSGRVHGKPVVMPGAAGSNLGVIDLTLHCDDTGRWKVNDHKSELRPICSTATGSMPTPVAEDPELVHLFSEAHSETRRRASQPVGHSDHPLHSYFSFCVPDRGLTLAAAAQAAALRPYLHGTSLDELPLLSAVAPSRFGGRAGPRHYTDVPSGQLCLRHVNDLYVFPNELQAVVVTAEQISDWLEMSAGVFNQITPGHQDELIALDRAGHNFDVLLGLTYQIDLSQPPRFKASGHLINPAHRRIRNIHFEGRRLLPNQHFVVALNSYRANGGGHFPFVEQAEPIALPMLPIQSILRDYLSDDLPQDPLQHAPRPFHLTSQPGSKALLRTGPMAQAHLEELAEYNPQVVCKDDEGFLLIRLTL
ncbi:bifunctional 2',3'-cyclic-nucleotide 2'-phosphodiesterase/3'-nucleotidase [Ruegeria atlantica]|uniref:bifunctional 2',3'-cyclic-nucleotide 2'-phosphodiesterase/3'-nucleotidase n=1 Tax=Ruegeria atlantica TaxID=81569 RepID=UPI0020C39E01|nr:bifunctional 2',3'-cyclic-nucleotide 2'-phosphodiesterase/3'-nucleotidase [Ruegeria atlantica]